ncbi:MAG: Cys-tRNA(Pro) deacylase [Coriobacteriia bacterium]|nr:Cys-tRNA(Pro) deacylase [Coriobacteriia bacterium]
MSKHIETKTNAMRVVEAAGIAHTVRSFPATAEMTGTEIALSQGLDPERVFKTLVTVGKSGQNYVFVIPVQLELDLKKAAAAVGEKSINMIKAKELLPLTGYVHGGCSPIGMKKQFPTTVDETAQLFETIYFSGGRIGAQIECSPADLAQVVPLTFADVAG